MIRRMIQKTVALAALIACSFLTSCGTSTPGPDGSKHQTLTGVSDSGYPGGSPADAGSPALASSTETRYSREQGEDQKKPAGEPGK